MGLTGNDFNGDGRDDVFWLTLSSSRPERYSSMWLGTADGRLQNSEYAHTPFQDPGNEWFVAAIGDFDGNGGADLSWGYGNVFLASHSLSVGTFLRQATTSKPSVTGLDQPKLLGSGDFNGDGHDDVLFREASGKIGEWLGGGSRLENRNTDITFVENSAAVSRSVDASWSVVAVNDFNGDGRDDVIWRHTSGEMAQWLANPNGGFTNNITAPVRVVDNSWKVIGSGDFNADGNADLLWRHVSGQLSQWLGQDDGSYVDNFAKVHDTVDRSWKVVDIGDYNGDEVSDLFWRHSSGVVTTWEGHLDGSFTDTYSINGRSIPLEWQVQSPEIYLF